MCVKKISHETLILHERSEFNIILLGKIKSFIIIYSVNGRIILMRLIPDLMQNLCKIFIKNTR